MKLFDKTFTFNQDPVNLFWSFLLIIFTIINLVIVIFTDNSIIYVDTDSFMFTIFNNQNNFDIISGISYIILYLINLIVTSLFIVLIFRPKGINFERISLYGQISLWMFVGFMNIIIMLFGLMIWLSIIIFNYINTKIIKFNNNIRSEFQKSEEFTTTSKSLWKRIVSKIIGIK